MVKNSIEILLNFQSKKTLKPKEKLKIQFSSDNMHLWPNLEQGPTFSNWIHFLDQRLWPKNRRHSSWPKGSVISPKRRRVGHKNWQRWINLDLQHRKKGISLIDLRGTWVQRLTKIIDRMNLSMHILEHQRLIILYQPNQLPVKNSKHLWNLSAWKIIPLSIRITNQISWRKRQRVFQMEDWCLKRLQKNHSLISYLLQVFTNHI